MAKNRQDSERVRAHYEALPYPSRDPADEARRLITGSPSHLDEINHYVFGGCLDLEAPFRAVARARAEARGLTNITFHQGSITEPPDFATAFDYVDCCGVLHHLPDPDAGLRALAGLLRPGGGMGLMVYGAYGRTGVYPMQAALRALAPEPDMRRRLKTMRALLADAPETNWLKRNPFLSSISDDDAAFADLLLHPIDRAYTVPEVAELVAQAGLSLTAFVAPARYDLATYLDDKDLRKRAAKLDWLEACALAETLCGNLKTHIFYVAKDTTRDAAIAKPADAAIPILLHTDAAALAASLRKTPEIRSRFEGLPVAFPVDAKAAGIAALIDGRRDIATLRADSGASGFDAAFRSLYRALNGLNLMLLRRPA